MKTYRTGWSVVFGIVAGVSLFAGGCSSKSDDTTASAEELAARTTTLALDLKFPPDPDFAGNSVWICGKRQHPADNKYPCFDGWEAPSNGAITTSTTPTTTTDGVCQCFDFPGDTNNGDKTDPYKMVNLCPSSDVNSDGTTGGAKWDFKHIKVYSKKGCAAGGGEVLNTDDNKKNFACYEREKLKEVNPDYPRSGNPNQALDEWLKPGWVENEIICITRNTNKEFDFDVCRDARDYDDDPLKYNCGCVRKEYVGSTYPPPPAQCECEQDSIKDGPIDGKLEPVPGKIFDRECNLVKPTY